MSNDTKAILILIGAWLLVLATIFVYIYIRPKCAQASEEMCALYGSTGNYMGMYPCRCEKWETK